MQFSAPLASGELDDHELGSPVGPLGTSGEAIAGSIAEHALCDACGRQGCVYRLFRRPGSSPAFAVYPVCDEAIKFCVLLVEVVDALA